MRYYGQRCSRQSALENMRANVKRTYRLEKLKEEVGVNIWFWEKEV